MKRIPTAPGTSPPNAGTVHSMPTIAIAVRTTAELTTPSATIRRPVDILGIGESRVRTEKQFETRFRAAGCFV